MSNIGERKFALIYDLDDNFVQKIKCSPITKRVQNSGFMGSGVMSLGQTLQIKTSSILNESIKASQNRVKYCGQVYLIAEMLTSDTAPISRHSRYKLFTILSLQ